MSIVPVDPAAQAAALLLQRDAGLAGQLVLGQIVQARVLRPLESGQYLVRMFGREEAVECAAPLRTGELIHGRVVSLGEQVEIERIERDSTEAPRPDRDKTEEAWLRLGGGRAAEAIEDLFRRYRGALDKEDAARLERAAARAERPERMALAGLVLAKSGLPLDEALLQALYAALGARSGALAPLPLEGVSPVWWSAAQRVLNAQGGGAVAHRVGMLPLEADGALVEVDAALFEENREAERPAGWSDRREAAPAALQHRRLVLSLETERLGRVELRAVMADTHMRVALATESEAATRALLRNGETLSRELADAGWQLDEVAYETRARHPANGAVAAAAEHLVTPGSVNRLL
jgi:hypothetical protein